MKSHVAWFYPLMLSAMNSFASADIMDEAMQILITADQGAIRVIVHQECQSCSFPEQQMHGGVSIMVAGQADPVLINGPIWQGAGNTGQRMADR